MTTDELRDWHAVRIGWKHIEWCEGCWNWRHDERMRTQDEHPFPATIDGAASAMPRGWEWTMCCVEGFGKGWFAQDENGRNTQCVPWTGDEIHDRYMLAKLAWEAIDKDK